MGKRFRTLVGRVRAVLAKVLYLSTEGQMAQREHKARRLRTGFRRTLSAARNLLIVSAIGVVGYWATWPHRAPEWTGFGGYAEGASSHGEKKLWDWLELLIIPVVLGAGAALLNKSERATDRKIADDRMRAERLIAEDNQHEERLQNYIDSMTTLLLERDLRKSKDSDEVRSIARTRTLTVLRSLDRARKGWVLGFLYEARLIERDSSVVHLSGADLSNASLSKAVLSEADLSAADLAGADLRGANLTGADLSGADLGYTSLMANTDLTGADLSGADLTEANLWGADLSFAVLKGTRVGDEQLLATGSLTGATMPDGSEQEWDG